MKLWVDDIRTAPEGWVWAKSYKEAIQLLEAREYDFEIISLDYALGNNKTGYDILCKIEDRVENYQNCKPLVGIHTIHPIAKIKMQKIADKLNKRTLKKR